MKGELHSTRNHLWGGLAMGDSFSFELINLFSGVATSRNSNEYNMYLPRGCLTIYIHTA